MNVASCQASIVAQSQEETTTWQQCQHLSLCLPKLKAVVHHAVLEPFVTISSKLSILLLQPLKC